MFESNYAPQQWAYFGYHHQPYSRERISCSTLGTQRRLHFVLPLNPRIKGVVRLSLSPPRRPFPSRPPLIIISCAYFWCLRLKSCCELNIFIITSLSFTDQLTKYPRCQGNLACFVYVVNSRVNDNKSLFQITRFSLPYLTNYLTIRVKFLVYLSWNLHSITV